MIVNGILLVFQGIINILLLPLNALNISIDFISNIAFVQQFISIGTYLLPWNKLLPLFTLTITIFGFRILISVIKLILDFIPFE